jgi:hypothetical protein
LTLTQGKSVTSNAGAFFGPDRKIVNVAKEVSRSEREIVLEREESR